MIYKDMLYQTIIVFFLTGNLHVDTQLKQNYSNILIMYHYYNSIHQKFLYKTARIFWYQKKKQPKSKTKQTNKKPIKKNQVCFYLLQIKLKIRKHIFILNSIFLLNGWHDTFITPSYTYEGGQRMNNPVNFILFKKKYTLSYHR